MKNVFYEAVSALGAFALVSALMTGCTKDTSSDNNNPNDGKLIEFAISASPAVPAAAGGMACAEPVSVECRPLSGGTREMFLHAIVVEGIEPADRPADPAIVGAAPLTDATIADAGVLAFNFDGEWHADATPQFMYDVRIAKSLNWKTNVRYPNNASRVRFYAYAPYACKGATLSGKDAAGVPEIRYTVPTAVADQQDLLVGRTADVVSSSAPKELSLDMKHALAAVQFVTGDDIAEGTVQSIALKGVYTTGVCTLADDMPVWRDVATTQNISLAVGKAIDGSENVPITTAEQTFMMIPQTLPEGASVEVVILADGKPQTLSCSIAGSRWQAGYTNVYKVSSSSITGEPVLSIDAPNYVSHGGGTASYNIASYKLRTDGSKTPLAWSIKGYSTDDGATWTKECPFWLTLPSSGEGGADPTEFNATIKAQTPTSQDDMLHDNMPVAGTYDLSTCGGTKPMNTANCYLVNAAGRYSLPLVYGNAIKNGAKNESAYISIESEEENTLTTFTNHLGAPITDPYIYNNDGCKPVRAILVWQDAYELVTNVALAADGRSLTFEVGRQNIRQGNAVVGILDSSERIIWSWHIWITAYTLGSETVSVSDRRYGGTAVLMPINLGWCSSSRDAQTYAGRKVLVKFGQEGSRGKEMTVAFVQSAHARIGMQHAGNCPYYQWGRKDPMRPAGDNFDDKAYYTSNAKYNLTSSAATHAGVAISDGIQNPHIFFCGYDTWTQCHYRNLWNSTPDTGKITKTVYDPSPAGFTVLSPKAATLLCIDGKKLGWNNGYVFKGDGRDVRCVLPAVGRRDRLSALREFNQSDFYWLASSDAERLADALFIQEFDERSTTEAYRSEGGAIRCVQEQQ